MAATEKKPPSKRKSAKPAKADKPNGAEADASKVAITPAVVNAAYLDKAAHLRTVQERIDAGKALRVTCPRDSQAGFSSPADRPDPIDLLIASSVGRIEQLVPIRYGRMMASPFAFFRGGAAIMAADLSRTPCTGIGVQSCGDAHLANFGAFTTPERRIMFDINDFDETFSAPWEWDLKRPAASFAIASAHNGHKAADCRAAAASAAREYGSRMRELAEMKVLDAWYSFIDWEDLIEGARSAHRHPLGGRIGTKNFRRCGRSVGEAAPGRQRLAIPERI